MELDGQIRLSHLLLTDRKCRVCGENKNLVESFYRTRKDRGASASSYSYECKDCTKKRVVIGRMTSRVFDKWEYPDW